MQAASGVPEVLAGGTEGLVMTKSPRKHRFPNVEPHLQGFSSVFHWEMEVSPRFEMETNI